MSDLFTARTAKRDAERVTTAMLKAALRKAFPLPEYATFFEVGDATGGRQSRWADAVSMACWPSRGLLIWGFEIKASRADWLREKKDPRKSCAIQRYCHRWVLFTAPGVIQDGELPDTWGHMELAGGKVCTRRTAPALTPEALEAPFVAALLRRSGQADADLVAQMTKEATATLQANFETRIEEGIKARTRENEYAREALEKFEAAAGVRIRGWEAEDIGKALRALVTLRSRTSFDRLGPIAKSLRELAEQMDVAAAEVAALPALMDEESA